MTAVDPAVNDGPHDALAVRVVGAPGGVGFHRGRGPVDMRIKRIIRPHPENDRLLARLLGGTAVLLHQVRRGCSGQNALVKAHGHDRQSGRNRLPAGTHRIRLGWPVAACLGLVVTPQAVEHPGHRDQAARIAGVQLDQHRDLR